MQIVRLDKYGGGDLYLNPELVTAFYNESQGCTKLYVAGGESFFATGEAEQTRAKLFPLPVGRRR